MARITLKKEKVDLYHGRLHSKAWQCWLQVVYILPRRRRPADEGGGAPPRHRPGTGTGTHLPLPWRPLPNRVCLPRRQAAPGPPPRPGPLAGPAALSFQHRLRRPLLGPAPGGAAPRPLFPAQSQRHNLEEEIHQRIAAGSAAGRNAPNSGAGRRRIPPERLWLRTPSRNGAGRTLNADPGPERHTGSGLKMCPNHRQAKKPHHLRNPDLARHSAGHCQRFLGACLVNTMAVLVAVGGVVASAIRPGVVAPRVARAGPSTTGNGGLRPAQLPVRPRDRQ